MAILIATAVAPTDPAVVFSVLGRREIAGRSGTILEGESGANDPVGIAPMSSLLAAGALSVAGVPHAERLYGIVVVVVAFSPYWCRAAAYPWWRAYSTYR